MLALPIPSADGSIELLTKFLNVADNSDLCLLMSWMVAALRPTGPYPLLILTGEHGSAKSTTARAIVSLIDPSRAPLRAEPRTQRDLMITANNRWVLAFDNLSYLPNDLSDSLCRLSTGGGFSTRQLYTDDEEMIFESQRPVILTSIDDVVRRSDLLDRAIVITLPSIPDYRRQTEANFWRRFEDTRPATLGLLLNGVCAGLRNLPDVRLPLRPRMADFVEWAEAAAPAFGWTSRSVLHAYSRNRGMANELALEASPVADAIINDLQLPFAGTASELLNALGLLANDERKRSKQWPKTATHLSGALHRIAPNLRRSGIDVTFERTAHARHIVISRARSA
jgi:hypothetical protein